MRELNAQELIAPPSMALCEIPPVLDIKAYLDACQLEPNRQQPLLLDVRQSWEIATCKIDYYKIENSAFIPMAQIPAKIESLDLSRETVVICHHGIRSRSVARYLEQHGFNKVINLSGGVAQWAKMVDHQMVTY